MYTFSCKNCKSMVVGCHATCETYIREKAEHDKLREKIHKQHDIEQGLNHHPIVKDRHNRRKI